jgi:hypothetical protein
MPAELSITLDTQNLAKFRRLLSANKLIAAQSLTFTAERAQAAWRVGNSVFHKRRPWIDMGVRIKHATPGNLNARVGSIDKFMGRHVIGVDEPKVAASGSLFVPIQPVAEQPTHTGIRARIRQMMRTKNKPFWRNGNLLRREGPGHDAPLKILAVLRKSVEIKPRLPALEIVDATVQREFPTVYERLLLKWAASN